MTEEWIGDGIRYTEIHDPKFRSCLLLLQFYAARDAQNAPVLALLTDLLTASSAEFPGLSALRIRLDALYAADFSAKLSLYGDAAALSFSASWLDDRFALNGEPITAEMLSLVTGCLLAPHTEHGSFCDPEFRVCKQNLLDDIDCEQNDKRLYALHNAAAACFAGEPAAIPPYGSRSAAEAITPAQAYAVWQEVLRTAQIDIVCILPSEKPVRSALTAAFSGIARQPAVLPLNAPSPLKPEPLYAEKTMPLNQSKLVMIYKYRSLSNDMLRMLNALLGGINNSLLFLNVREKQSLCYYCISTVSALKSVLTVDLGVQTADLQAAQDAVAAQIACLQRGDFPDSMCREAVLDYERQAAVTSNVNASVAARIADGHLFEDDRTPEEIAAALSRITKAQIMEAAAQLTLDTVFVLRAEEADDL